MNSSHTPFHPRWHRERLPIFWWLGKLSYTRFISRELTSVAVGYAALLLLLQAWMLSRGEAAYARFSSLLASPPVLIFHFLLLSVLLFHTLTWLHLAPKAMVVRLAGRRLPDALVLTAHYLTWLLASAVVAWGLLGN